MRWNRKVLTALLAAAVLVAAGVVGAVLLTGRGDAKAAGSSKPSETPTTAAPEVLPLQEAWLACHSGTGGGTLSVADEGRTLVIDTKSSSGPTEGLVCALASLETSKSIVAQLQHAAALTGIQQADDNGLHYQFSYHPDTGINMVITDTASP